MGAADRPGPGPARRPAGGASGRTVNGAATAAHGARPSNDGIYLSHENVHHIAARDETTNSKYDDGQGGCHSTAGLQRQAACDLCEMEGRRVCQ